MKIPALLNYTKYARHFLFRTPDSPLYFVFFVTRNCNSICRHCLLGARKPVKNELSLNEIEKISATMGDIMFLLLTGGEPFLRKDLPEIAQIFYKNNSVQNLGIPTNGSLTDRVVESSVKILDTCPGIDFAVDISIDGVREDHDRIRGVPGLSEKAEKTYRELEKLKKHYRNFNLNVGLTVSSYNQDKLSSILEYLSGTLNVKTVNYLLVRGKPRDNKSLHVNPGLYKKFGEELERFEEKGTLTGYENFPYSDFVNSIRKVRRRVISDILTTGRGQSTCLAGRLGGILQSDGEVFPCELIGESLGNLREHDYNFPALWNGEKACKTRERIKKTGCFCTYECFLTLSVFFTPKLFCRVFSEWGKIKYRKIKAGWGS